MSRIKRGIFILFFAETFLCFLLGAGCWNLREPQAQAVVMALAVDLDEESGLFEVVVEVGVPSALVGGGDGGEAAGEAAGSSRRRWSAPRGRPFSRPCAAWRPACPVICTGATIA